MKKLALSLIVLAGCSSSPTGDELEKSPVSLARVGPMDPQSDQPETQSPETGPGATTADVTPSTAPESTVAPFVPPRPVQTTVLSVSTTIPRTTSGSTLRDCIAYYESTNGALDSNLYQFVPGTWRAYGGTGSPENASVAEQNAVFERAWADGGPHHWAAQKDRCF